MEQALDRLLTGRTALIIAHRLETIKRADKIVILEQGKIREYGSRELLMKDPASTLNHLLRVGLEEEVQA